MDVETQSDPRSLPMRVGCRTDRRGVRSDCLVYSEKIEGGAVTHPKRRARKVMSVKAWGIIYPSGDMSPITAGTRGEAFTQAPPGWRVVRVRISLVPERRGK